MPSSNVNLLVSVSVEGIYISLPVEFGNEAVIEKAFRIDALFLAHFQVSDNGLFFDVRFFGEDPGPKVISFAEDRLILDIKILAHDLHAERLVSMKPG